MKRLLLFVCCCFLLQQAVAQTPIYDRLKIYLDGQNVQQLGALGLACDHGNHRAQQWFESDFLRTDRALLEQHGFRYDVLIEDVAAYYVRQNARTSSTGNTGRQGNNARNSTCIPEALRQYPVPANFRLGSMGGYFTYQEMLNELDSMHAKYPHLISPRAVIDSNNLTHNQNFLHWVRISDNPLVDEQEPEALYTALHHSREPLGLSQLIYYMWYLLEAYDNNDPEVRYLVNNTALYFVPCVNPDGYLYNEQTNPNGGGLWRKNRRNNGNGSFGVDLNRNYAFAFAHDNVGSSGDPTRFDYRGPSAFSEPETQNIRDFCLGRQFKLSFNYHTYGNLLIYPWAYNSLATPDNNRFVAYSAICTQDNAYKYGTNVNTVGYNTNGDADDWFYGEQQNKGKILALTPEAGPGNFGFWPPDTVITELCATTMWQNLALAHLLLNYAEAIDKSSSFVDNVQSFIPFETTQYGLSPDSLSVSVIPLTTNIQSIGAPFQLEGLPLVTEYDSIALVLQPTISEGDSVQYVVILDNKSYQFIDTVTRVYKTFVDVFTDNANNFQHWANQGPTSSWSTTQAVYYSAPSSITDSDTTNYANNTRTEILLQQYIDLSQATGAQLQFKARWDIEKGYDYVQVLAAGNSGFFEPLCGKYTVQGASNQVANEPLYDGRQLTWVGEEMCLDDYLGQAFVQLKFVLQSDFWFNKDGFYFDDVVVRVINPVMGVQEVALENWELGQAQPNPAQWQVFLPFELKRQTGTLPRLRIVNSMGQICWEQQLEAFSNGLELSVEDWAEGVYYYQLLGSDQQTNAKKFVVIK